MKYEVYSELTITDDFSIVDFMSIGKNGDIPKRIAFTATEVKNVFNLAFGDISDDGEIDDYIISDNGDRNKILATIVNVVDDYTKKFPERWIILRGSTKERTSLYRMAIGINLDELSINFDIYALLEESLVPFVKNMEINAFLIKRKIV